MVSNEEIAKGVAILLTESKPRTLYDIVHELGQKLGFDLSHKVDFIRDQINLVHLRSQSQSHGGGVVVQDAVGKSSEKAKKGGATGTKRGGGSGHLYKLCGITPELQVIVGESALSRTDVCMVSNEEIAKGVAILLTESKPRTLYDIVHQLGQKLGFDLSRKADFIRDQLNLVHLRSQSQSHYHHPPPPPPPSQTSVPHPVATSGIGRIAKDHFALQQRQHAQYHFGQPQPSHVPQPQFHLPRLALQQQQQQQPHFSKPTVTTQAVVLSPSAQPSQVQSLPEVKSDGGGVVVQDAVGKSSEKAKKGGATGTKRGGGSGDLNKLCGITPELQVIVGESALSRTDIVKQLWAYIKKNNLQDPGNKKNIICDDALRVVFETDCIDMFNMNKLLAKHIIPLEPTEESSRKRSKVTVETQVEPEAESADNVPCQVIISDALANCLGTGEREMSQSEAFRLVWEYIKVNNLEDPRNPVMILCDEKLRELFGCESISTKGIAELLVQHHLVKQ